MESGAPRLTPSKLPSIPAVPGFRPGPDRRAEARVLAGVLAVAAASAFLVAGTGVLVDTAWAQAAAITGATVSLLLTIVYFHRWLSFNILINAAIIFVALAVRPQQSFNQRL